ncbi:MAG: sugar ABC transporter ATP-binding protein [Calditrichales bacterium]|nr:MAG: sugar ABC transporter ATP-binding protein [Calditrichales bacterium]
MGEPVLRMQGIGKSFGATTALDHVDFEVYPGQVHALVGENGAGKSTLMKILSGVYQPDLGRMLLDGKPFTPRNPLESRNQGVGMIYQELSLAPHLTVEENICLGVEPVKHGLIDWPEVRRKAETVLRIFDHPEISPDSQTGQLPISAQQLVEIGRALALGCRLVVFDEPTSSLDRADVTRLFEVIRRLKNQGIAVVYISHFLEEVKEIADQITVLRDGQVQGSTAAPEITSDQIVKLMVGREVKKLYPRSERSPGKVLLQVENLSGIDLPNDVSFSVSAGEVVGVFGLIGAGRTEFLKTIFGLEPVRTGQVTIGMFSGRTTPLQCWQQGVGLMSEDRQEEGLVQNRSIADNITLTDLKRFGPAGIIYKSRQYAASRHWIDQLDIRAAGPEQKVDELSGGNQQKAIFARLLQHDVDLLLMDEPTRGIDVAAKAIIYEAIDRITSGKDTNGRPGKGVVMVSSYIPELLGICDRIAVMYKGNLGPAVPVSDLDANILMAAATGQRAVA